MEKEKDDSVGRNFDTPVDALFSNGLRGPREGTGCVEPVCAVSLSFAAAQRVVPRLGFLRWVSGGGLRTQERICTTSL